MSSPPIDSQAMSFAKWRLSLFEGRHFPLYGGFIVVYVVLDWLSNIHQFANLPITPWNPCTGVAVALLVVRGVAAAPWVAASMLLSEMIIRGMDLGWPAAIGLAAVASMGYAATAEAFVRFLKADPGLGNVRDVLLLIGAALIGSLLVAVGMIGVLVLTDKLPVSLIVSAGIRQWVGDLSGVVAVAFLLLRLPSIIRYLRERPRGSILIEAVLWALALAATVWLVFGLEATDEFRLFYLLFVPVVGLALRAGFDGTCISLTVVQVCMIAAVQWRGFPSPTVVELQMLMVALKVTALLTGIVVTARERAETALRLSERQLFQRESQLAQVSRLSSVGAMASALAHELNQPLTAIRAYSRAAQRFLESPGSGAAHASTAMSEAMRQIDLAGDILTRLRPFLRKGKPQARPNRVERILRDTVTLAGMDPVLSRAIVDTKLGDRLPLVFADRIQAQQVLLNLLRNAVEASSHMTERQPHVSITAETAEAGLVMVSVRDNGPGISDEVRSKLFSPFTTDKPSGLGLGLALSHAIVSAHGGNLWLESTGPNGSDFRFTLRVANSGALQ